MSVVMILDALFIGPLKLVFEIIYALANRFLQNPGLSIIVLSLVMNFLVLPLYKRADAMQEASRDIEAKLHDGVAHIKKTFSGDERMMILQEYYRQNHYKPTDALNGSVSLLLEVPFFMAAYQFLSNLQLLQGAALGPIADLGAPDGLIVLGGITINALPVLMTLVNVISSAIYLKDFPLKTKIQLYAMAGFFLVFLYDSPSGLVFYWMLNNVFSLVKTIFYKIKNPQKVAALGAGAAGAAALVVGIAAMGGRSIKLRVLIIGAGLALQLPLFWQLFGRKIRRRFPAKPVEPNRKVFLLGVLFLTLLVGMLIPSNFIAASPQEFIDAIYFHNPMWYIVHTFCLAAGTFLIWMNVFYSLVGPGGKALFDRTMWVLCGLMLVNYMFFGTNMGVISSSLFFENNFDLTAREKLLNLAVMVLLGVVLSLVFSKWNGKTAAVLLTATIAVSGMSTINLVQIDRSVDRVITGNQFVDSRKCFSFSRNGKNVVVLMLDRAMGEYIPYMLNEKPELRESLSGFTYYPNVVSFGAFTNWGAPALFGGYEYTPVEINKRDTETMVSKHNESLKVMPVLFSQNGFAVTVCDPPYANHQWIPDLTIYKDYPGITAYNTEGGFGDTEFLNATKQRTIDNRHRNFFCFSIMKTMPLVIQPTLYNSGRYNQADYEVYERNAMVQVAHSTSASDGMNTQFLSSYNVLASLAEMTEITDDAINTALIMNNNVTHEPMLLQAPEYTPIFHVDNTEYDRANADRFRVDGKTLRVENVQQMSHYHTNMAAILRLAEWFDYLKEMGVYDNTRIILVSDHGRGLAHSQELMMEDASGNVINAEWFYPLLMVKDFGSSVFTICNDFMTNADVPTLATAQLIENPVNPFTGNAISSEEKFAHEQFVSLNMNSNVDTHLGNTYKEAKWASVKDDIWDAENWTFYEDEVVLKEHAMP